jgi:hypothetical protein
MTLHKSLASAVALAVLIPGAALAHHGWSSYDAEKTLTVTGPLTDIAWRNPHGEAKIKYDGKTWAVVLAPVARMEARGLTQAMISNGKPVKLVGYPRKDGVAEMRIERVTVDGKTVELR